MTTLVWHKLDQRGKLGDKAPWKLTDLSAEKVYARAQFQAPDRTGFGGQWQGQAMRNALPKSLQLSAPADWHTTLASAKDRIEGFLQINRLAIFLSNADLTFLTWDDTAPWQRLELPRTPFLDMVEKQRMRADTRNRDPETWWMG